MRDVLKLRFAGTRLSVMLLLLTLLVGGGIFVANAAAEQECRDVGNITICGDIVDEFDASFNGGGFRLRNNLKLGPKGGAAVVKVGDTGSIFDGTVLPGNITTASYFHLNQVDPNTGTTDFLIGEVSFINDPTGLALFGTSAFDHLPVGGEVTAGRLFVDTAGGRIFLPAAGAVPIFVTRGVKRNEAYNLNFISRTGAHVFFQNGGTVDERTVVNGEFDLITKKFKATMPVNLKQSDSSENPTLQLTLRAEFAENGSFSGSIDGFKFKLAGLLMDVSGIVITPGNASGTVASFEAALVKVLKADNPSVPNLDPTDATLLFSFTKLKYKDGKWEIGGVEVGVKDWEFGAAFKMTNQTLGIVAEGTAQAFQIKSTMQFGAGASASKLPIILKIGRAPDGNGQFKPVFAAGLTNFNPKLGTMTFKLTEATFVGDGANDFFGIQANSAQLQWPATLGGQTAAGVAGFKLGISKEKKLKFSLGNGTVGLPPLENSVFKATLQATIGVVSETMTITGTGTFNLKLPGNSGVGVTGSAIIRYNKNISEQPATVQAVAAAPGAVVICRNPVGANVTCPSNGTPPPPPPPTSIPFEMKLNGFNVKIAGFGMNILNPRGLGDGGFAADTAQLSFPSGLSVQNPPAGGVLVQGLVVKGNGDISLQGGGFELPPLKVGSLNFVALRGSFTKNAATGNYEFRAGGKLPLPGIEPGSASGGISVDLVVRVNATTNAFNGAGVVVSFGSPPLPPLPIGATGMNLTGLTGSFDVGNGTITIGVTVTASSKFAIPIPVVGSIPLVKATGGVVVQVAPFKFTGNLSLSVLIFEVATASVNIGAGQGFDGGDGINLNANVQAVIVQGAFRLRAGKGVPGDPEKRRFAAAADFKLGIGAGQFGVGRPPIDLYVTQIGLSGGVFKDNNFSPARETIGIKGTYNGIVLNFGVFLDLQKSLGSGDFIKVRNLEKYVIIPAAAVRAAAARGELGFASRMLTIGEARDLGFVVASDQVDGLTEILADSIPITLAQTTSLVAGINFPSGNPTVRLQLPDNTILTQATVNGSTTGYLTSTSTVSGTNIFYIVHGATPGIYKLLIDNAPAQYENASYTLNESPKATINSIVCGGSEPADIIVTCTAGVDAAGVNELDATQITINWNTTDIDSPNAKVTVGYVADTGDKNTLNFADIQPVVEDRALGAGSYVLDLTEIGTGNYRMVVMVDDDQNGSEYVASDVVVKVVDKRAPAVPAGLSPTSQAGELLIKWTQNAEYDLAGYELGFGLVADTNQFVYTRTMGPKAIITGTNSIVDAKIWGLHDDTTVFYGLRAYDKSGNYSAWTPLQSAKPWALAPNTWTPTPNGTGTAAVEIGFDLPLKPESLTSSLKIFDANNNEISGQLYALVDFDSNKTVGIGFVPGTTLKGSFKAVLKGGAGGVQAEDNRTMGGDYSWNFTLQPEEVYLPLVSR